MDYTCKICDKELNSKQGLSRHINSIHDTNINDYLFLFKYKKSLPQCACGCGETVELKGWKTAKFISGHNGKLKPPGLYLTDEAKEKTRKRLQDPERIKIRTERMIQTKRQQSLEGTLSERHWTKTKSEKEREIILTLIGKKSSKTKRIKIQNGELVPWNKGLTADTDSRVAKSSGEAHYRFNPNKDIIYDNRFHDKNMRGFLLEQQNGKCFCCDSKNDLCLHHIDWDKRNSNSSNLIYVCRPCHMGIHNSENINTIFILNVTEFKKNNEQYEKNN